VTDAAASGRSIRHHPGLARVVTAFCGFGLGEAAVWLATIVYAFERGGVSEAGGVAVIGLVFAMVVAPFAAFAGDRFRSDRALAAGFGLQFLTTAATATAIWVDAPLFAYAGAILASGAYSLTRPVIGSVLPSITSRPEELVRANVVIGVVDDIGGAAGPLIAAALFAWADIGAAFMVFAGVAALGMLLTWDLGLAHTADGALAGMRRRELADQVVGGLRALRVDATLRAVVAAMAVGALALGVLDVLGVVFADVRLDAGGGAVAGLLAAAVGMGSIVGSLVAGRLVGRDVLRRPFLMSVAALGVPIVVLAALNQLVPAMLAFALVGVGRSLLVVTGAVALQRLAPSNLLVRIFGVYEGLTMLAMAVGALTVPLLVGWLGVGWAAGVSGAAVFVVALAAVTSVVRRLGDVPHPDPEVVERLLADPLFAPLDVLAIAALTANACEEVLPEGAVAVREGDAGDRYFLVVDGELEVSVAGQVTDHLTAGASFGEIALVRDLPRQATVTALTGVELLTIDRAAFLEAVTGHPQSRTTADQVVDRHLGAR
jgi:MFS family permease